MGYTFHCDRGHMIPSYFFRLRNGSTLIMVMMVFLLCSRNLFKMLPSGGTLVVEPQEWQNYKRAVSKNTSLRPTFKGLKLKPNFESELTGIGFMLFAVIDREEGGIQQAINDLEEAELVTHNKCLQRICTKDMILFDFFILAMFERSTSYLSVECCPGGRVASSYPHPPHRRTLKSCMADRCIFYHRRCGSSRYVYCYHSSSSDDDGRVSRGRSYGRTRSPPISLYSLLGLSQKMRILWP